MITFHTDFDFKGQSGKEETQNGYFHNQIHIKALHFTLSMLKCIFGFQRFNVKREKEEEIEATQMEG